MGVPTTRLALAVTGAVALASWIGALQAADPLSYKPNDVVRVATDRAPLQVGADVLARLSPGETLKVLRVRDNWLWVETGPQRQAIKGWIDASHVAALPATQQPRPGAPAPQPRPSPPVAQLRRAGVSATLDRTGNVTAVSFRQQPVTDELLVLVAGLEHLETLDLSFSEGVTDQRLQHLAGLTKLRDLNLMLASEVTDAGLKRLGGLTALERLNLSGTRITDAGLEALKPLSQLLALDLSGDVLQRGAVTGSGLAHLRDGRGLRELSLYNTAADDAALQQLAQFQRLESLNLGDTQVTDEGLAAIKPLTSLKTLDLSYCRQITDAGIEGMGPPAGLADLRLNFTAISDATLKRLHTLKELKRLSVESTRVSGGALAELKAALPDLEITGP